MLFGKPHLSRSLLSRGSDIAESRGAVIYSNEKGANYSFKLEGFPHGAQGYWGGLGHIDVIVQLVDAWLDAGQLPPPYKR